MEKYKNVNQQSAVVAFEVGEDFIKVKFNDSNVYLYTHRSAGAHNIETMKVLARRGMGLNSFINLHVRKKYASKSSSPRSMYPVQL